MLLAIRNALGGDLDDEHGRAVSPWERMVGPAGCCLESWREHGLGSWLDPPDGTSSATSRSAPIREGSGVFTRRDRSSAMIVHPGQWGKGIVLEAGLAAGGRPFPAGSAS